jgi:hypothetical protein
MSRYRWYIVRPSDDITGWSHDLVHAMRRARDGDLVTWAGGRPAAVRYAQRFRLTGKHGQGERGKVYPRAGVMLSRSGGIGYKVAFGLYDRGQLLAALSAVTDPQDWKLPISAVVPAYANRDLISAAIVFHTGGSPAFAPEGDGLRVEAAGYYQCTGA